MTQLPDAVTLVRKILAQHAQCAPEALSLNDELVDLDIDSLKFIVVILDVEQALNRHVFDIENVGKLRSVGDILKLVDTVPSL
jgi:acyl carrier protein